MLWLPNFQKTFVVEKDASSLGIRAVLTQDDQPFACLSKKLSLASAHIQELYYHSSHERVAPLLVGEKVYNQNRSPKLTRTDIPEDRNTGTAVLFDKIDGISVSKCLQSKET